MSTQTIRLEHPWKVTTRPRNPWTLRRPPVRRRRRTFQKAFRRLLGQVSRLARCTELREGAFFGMSLALMLSSLWLLGRVSV